MDVTSKKSKLVKSETHNKKLTENKAVEVLYQKLGDRWYAFSLVDDEVFYGSITQNELDTPPIGHYLSKKVGHKV
jgi:hypothetical protein